jgi:phage terminase large subunit GpA-like protein
MLHQSATRIASRTSGTVWTNFYCRNGPTGPLALFRSPVLASMPAPGRSSFIGSPARFYRRIVAIKTANDPRAPIWRRRPSRPDDGRPSGLFSIGGIAAKEITVARLGIAQPGPGFCHFPQDRDYEYYEQLLSEKPIRKFVRGVPTRVWIKASGARNEALDCRIYNLAALYALKSYGLDLNRAADRAASRPTYDRRGIPPQGGPAARRRLE